MKPFAAVIAACLMLAPTIASASYLCDKAWQAKFGHSCPAGSVFDASTHSCIVTSG